MNVTAEDQKMLNEITAVLEQCYMKDVSIKKQFAVTIACEKFGLFKQRLSEHLQQVAKFSAVTPPPVEAKEEKKKAKK